MKDDSPPNAQAPPLADRSPRAELEAWLREDPARSTLALDGTVFPNTSTLALQDTLTLNEPSQETLAPPQGRAPLAALPRIATWGPEDATPGPPKRIDAGWMGELDVVERLGAGGMGEVHLVYQRALRRHVVIKRLKPSRRGDPNAARALFREGILTGALEHPNIVPVHALGCSEDGLPVLVMKRVSGVSWQELLDDPDHPTWTHRAVGDRLAWHLQVLTQVCNAVHFAHSHGVLHRDIKPANVMIGDFGEVYLLDWGVGVRLNEHGEAEAGPLAGTPIYMAPEMFEGHAHPMTVRTDVYLLGATLHEVLTGEPLHKGSDLISIMCEALASRPTDFGPEVPEELARLCNAATHASPQERPTDADAFRRALAQALERRGALELCASARARLEAMDGLWADVAAGRAELDTERVVRLHELAGECRFALRQALNAWDGFAEARTLLDRCTTRLIDVELARGNVQSARVLLSELSTPDDAVAERVDAEERRRDEASQRLAALERDLDVNISSRERTGMIVAAALLSTTTVALTAWFDLEARPDARLTFVWITLTFLVGGLVGLGLFRRVLFGNAVNRWLTLAYLTACVALLANRVHLWLRPSVPFSAIFSADMLTLAAIFAVLAAVVHKRLGFIALIFVTGFGGIVAVPERSLLIMGLTITAGLWALAALWGAAARQVEEGRGRGG